MQGNQLPDEAHRAAAPNVERTRLGGKAIGQVGGEPLVGSPVEMNAKYQGNA